MSQFTGHDLIEMGYQPGPHFPDMLHLANSLGFLDRELLDVYLPEEPLRMLSHPVDYSVLLETNSADEWHNLEAICETMDVLMRTPVVKAGAVLPDACPAGPVGTIPVGGVVASTEIHPGMHSADICCSVMMTEFRDTEPADVLDRIYAVTHFGPGGCEGLGIGEFLQREIPKNKFTKDLLDITEYHMCTQGDGNHFSFVGVRKSNGRTCLVTHHGSRGFGARVYKAGMKVAEQYRKKLCPELPKMNAWIPADSADGKDYWDALHLVSNWTWENHRKLHALASAGRLLSDRIFNEHNFVFQKEDGLFYHAKGATPAFGPYIDTLTLVPLNMAEPVLITRGLDNPNALGFSPHGAGRNYSRSEHIRRGIADLHAETEGLDVRFWSGHPDPSELPSAYKNAAEVRRQMEEMKLAEVVDEIEPYGCIMAGDWEKDAPWRKK